MTQASDGKDAGKGSEEHVPFADNPAFFFRLLATAKTPRLAFYVAAFGIAWWWYRSIIVLPVFAFLVVLELGPWSWPRQIIWRGKKATKLQDVIGDFLAPMRYGSADNTEGWTVWSGPQHLLKPWRSAPRLYTRFANGTFILRGDRWAIGRLRKLFDGERFKELSRQLRRK
jgi:hypothetical protein